MTPGPVVLCAAHARTCALSEPLWVERVRGGDLRLADARGGALRCGKQLKVDTKGGRGPWARWHAVELGDGAMSLLCRGHHDAGRSVYLAAREGGLVGSAEPSAIVMVPADAAASPAVPVPAPPPVAAPPPAYTLSAAERASFIERGYLVLPSLVTAKLVDDAVRAINISLGESLRLGTASDDARAGASARADPAVLGLLYSSPLHGVVNQLLSGRASRPKMAQLPLRFPNAKADLPDEQWHIDGMKKWHMSPFNLLVGIALSDQPDDDHGNLAVHEAVVRARAARGDEAAAARAGRAPRADDDDTDDPTDEVANPWQGLKPVPRTWEQLRLSRGDVIIAHQKLPHRVSPNRSPHIRYQAYYRISHADHRPESVPIRPLWDGFDVHGEVGPLDDAMVCGDDA